MLTPEQTETFQRAIERGWEMPLDPPDLPEMLADASAYLAARKPEAPAMQDEQNVRATAARQAKEQP
ncbi:MAG: hypothetical protein B7Z36_02320 [Novosphingobium sp. 12-63-9]|nr:MAG: hypothetical protein B7Z36_02320 [Novosphingobium sp. 12-63-9]